MGADAENGPQVMGTETTLEELREKLLSAEIIDKRPVDPEKAKELKEALDEEFQKLGDKAEDDHGPDQTFIMMNRKIAALEKARLKPRLIGWDNSWHSVISRRASSTG